MPPSRCCSSVNEALKSALKSPPNEDAQGKLHPIRRLYACSFASGARDTAEAVGDRRAGRTPRLVVGPEHEVVDEELRASSEELCQRGAPLVGLESVLPVDPDPGQLLPPPRQLVAAPRQLLLLLEQPKPGCKPLFTRSGHVCRHRSSLPSSGFLRRSYRSRYDVLGAGREIDLVPGYRTVGGTSVAGFRWTR